MKMKWTLVAAGLATAGFAHAAEFSAPLDVTQLPQEPNEILQALAPEYAKLPAVTDHRENGDRRQTRGDQAQTPIPKSCVDANITEDQKAAIYGAVLDAKKQKIQVMADLKIALLDYSRAAMDKNSDKGAAEAAGGRMVDSVNKLASGGVALGTKVLYELVTPDQRKNTFLCIVKLHQQKGHKMPRL